LCECALSTAGLTLPAGIGWDRLIITPGLWPPRYAMVLLMQGTDRKHAFHGSACAIAVAVAEQTSGHNSRARYGLHSHCRIFSLHQAYLRQQRGVRASAGGCIEFCISFRDRDHCRNRHAHRDTQIRAPWAMRMLHQCLHLLWRSMTLAFMKVSPKS
jgi:hypothetical protein